MSMLRINLLDEPKARRKKDGSVQKEIPLAKIGMQFVNGGEKFDISLGNVRQAIGNFEERGFPIPITMGHFEPMERQRQPSTGWITKLFCRPIDDEQYLWGDVSWLKQTYDEIEEGKWKGLSLEFLPNDKDEKGNNVGFLIDGAAILNYPFFPGARVDLRKEDPERHLFTLAAWGIKEEAGMSKNKSATRGAGGKKVTLQGEEMVPVAEVVDGPIAEVIEAVQGGDVQELLGQIGELFAKLQSLLAPAAEEAPGEEGAVAPAEEVAELVSAELKAGRLGNAVTLLKLAAARNGNKKNVGLVKRLDKMDLDRKFEREADEGRRILMRLHAGGYELGLGDFAIEDDDEQVREWFKKNHSGIRTLEGLRCVAMHPERLSRVTLAGETSGGKSAGTSGDATTTEGRAIMVRKRAAEIKKEFPHEDLQMLVKRYKVGTVDEGVIALAKQELKNENPSVKEF